MGCEHNEKRGVREGGSRKRTVTLTRLHRSLWGVRGRGGRERRERRRACLRTAPGLTVGQDCGVVPVKVRRDEGADAFVVEVFLPGILAKDVVEGEALVLAHEQLWVSIMKGSTGGGGRNGKCMVWVVSCEQGIRGAEPIPSGGNYALSTSSPGPPTA